MIRIRCMAALVMPMVLLHSCFIFKPQRMQTSGTVPVADVFAQVVDQFKKAKMELDAKCQNGNIGVHRIELTEADVVFDNVLADQAAATLGLLVFKAGYTYTKTKETTVTYSLTEVAVAAPRHNLTQGKNEDALKDLIVASVSQFIAVAVPSTGNSKFIYEKDVEIDVSFKVDQNGSIEVSGPIGNFTPDVKLSRDVANTHTVKIKYAIDRK